MQKVIRVQQNGSMKELEEALASGYRVVSSQSLPSRTKPRVNGPYNLDITPAHMREVRGEFMYILEMGKKPAPGRY